MSPEIFEVIETTARCHRLPLDLPLLARCEMALHYVPEDDKDRVIDALAAAFQWWKAQ